MKQYVYTCKDGRTRMVFVDENGKHSSKSYPRILMEEKLGRPLEPYEDVHHKDGDLTNNDISNLEVQIHGEHQRMHHPKIYFDTIEKCVICGKDFVMTAEKWQNLCCDLKRKRPRNLTCSQSCSGKLGSGKYELLYDSTIRIKEYMVKQEQ